MAGILFVLVGVGIRHLVFEVMSRKLGTQVNKRHDRAIDLAPTFDETPADFDDTPPEALAALQDLRAQVAALKGATASASCEDSADSSDDAGFGYGAPQRGVGVRAPTLCIAPARPAMARPMVARPVAAHIAVKQGAHSAVKQGAQALAAAVTSAASNAAARGSKYEKAALTAGDEDDEDESWL